MRLVFGRLNLLLLFVALLLGRIASTKSAEPDTATPISHPDAPWQFQRLLVPADRPEDWPRDKSQRYLPISADEFESRLAQLRNAARPPQPQPSPLIRATYSAALLGENSLAGELTWEFDHPSPQTATLLGNCQLALDDFRWTADAPSADSPANLPAHGGNQNLNRDNPKAIVGNDQNGRLAALIDRAGKMSARWSLSGKRNFDGVLSFNVQLPDCPFNLLQLTLPADLAPTIDRGIITSHRVESTPDDSASGLCRWQIELGGNSQANLRIVKQSAPPAVDKTFIRQSFTYDFSSHGLEFYGDFRLDVLGAPLKQIILRLDQPLTIVRIRSGNTELPLSSLTTVHTPLGNTANSAGSADSGQGNPQELIVELPQPIHGPGQRLQIVAIAPLTWATPWQLPLMRVENADWQTGDARLRVPDSLLIDELSTEDCRQTTLQTAIDDNLADHLEVLPQSPTADTSLVFFNDHPRIELELTRRREQVRVTQGTSISLRANEGAGRYRGEFTIDQGELFVLQADIAPQWIIESVDSTPPGMVADWSQQLVRNRPGKLTLQLSTPLTPQHSLRLSITARRRSAPWGETLHADDLAMLHVPDAQASRRLILVQAAEPFQLQLRGLGELTRLDPVQLTAADASLLDEKPTDLVFVDDSNARNLAVSLLGKTPQYDTDIQAKVLVGDDRLTESYRFAVTPQGREVSRFQFRFSQPRATPLNWSIEGEPTATVAARRLTESEGSASNWPGEAWEAVLPAPRSTPLVLLATRTSPLTGDMPPALASLIEAQTQRGSIQVVSVGHDVPALRSRRLKSIPVDAPPAGQYATMLAAFRYDPEEDTLLTADPPLVVIPHGNSAPLPQAWIWQAQLTSRYSHSGAEHTLFCQVENAGLEKIQFQPPPGAILRSASIDGRQAAEFTSATTGPWKISLPASARFVTLALCYDELADQGAVASHAAPWPSCDVPILSRQWVVWTPPGMALADVQIGNRHPCEPPWTKRLFGPLARSVSDAPPSATAKTPNVPAAGLQSPWKAADQYPLIDSAAWTSYCFDGAESDDRIWIADKQSLTAWAWSLFVLAVAVRWWFGKQSLALDIALLGTATVIALLIPAAWTPLSAALWLGLFAGPLMVWVAHRSQLQQADFTPQAVSSSTPSKLVTATFVLGFFMALAAHRLVQAEETESAAASPHAQSSSPVRQVLVPVDPDGHPTGGLDYLPEAFYDELLRLTPAPSAPPQYLITRAIYAPRAEQSPNAKSSDPPAGNWQATFEMESLADHVV
ncbi:MAG TPA: hypothetical protein VMJ32_15835, partial [Pirellulales bacterium]|nr:hypothetical protein [Pirellulales bacterium]